MCRSDPVIWLSDGHKVDLTALVTDQPSDVQSVHYAVHVPAGDTVTHITVTRGPLGHLESLTVVADNPANSYSAGTTVNTHTNSEPDTVRLTIVNGQTDWNGSTSAQGRTNQTVLLNYANAQ